MADTAKTLLLVGGLGVGGYLAYEYFRYNNAISTLTGGNAQSIATVEAGLPFFTWLMAQWGGTGGLNTAQANAYNIIQNYLTTGQVPGGTPTAPGTTAPGQTTTVSTTPSSTTTSSGSSSPSTTASPAPPAPAPVSTVPVTNWKPALAVLLQQKINMTLATADQWNWAYGQIMGQGVDQQYNFNFDSVYGPVVNGARYTGQISANTFLQMAAAVVPGGLSGMGAIATFAGPRLSTVGNMLYSAHHQFPYVSTYSLRGGLGAPTQAMGFEKALFTTQRLRSNRII